MEAATLPMAALAVLLNDDSDSTMADDSLPASPPLATTTGTDSQASPPLASMADDSLPASPPLAPTVSEAYEELLADDSFPASPSLAPMTISEAYEALLADGSDADESDEDGPSKRWVVGDFEGYPDPDNYLEYI